MLKLEKHLLDAEAFPDHFNSMNNIRVFIHFSKSHYSIQLFVFRLTALGLMPHDIPEAVTLQAAPISLKRVICAF